MLDLSAIKLRVIPDEGPERELLAGGTRSGKSTLGEVQLLKFLRDYISARTLIIDSKPRFRAEWELNGVRADWRYRKWRHGSFIPGSVRLDIFATDFGLANAWKLGHRVAIAQTEKRAERPLLLLAIEKFFDQAKWGKWQMLFVDELADFFNKSGFPLAGLDSIERSVRAGGERGQGGIFGTQRPRGIPIPLMSEMNKLGLFRLDFAPDVAHLHNGGLPDDIEPPIENRIFYLYDKASREGDYYRLNMPSRHQEPESLTNRP